MASKQPVTNIIGWRVYIKTLSRRGQPLLNRKKETRWLTSGPDDTSGWAETESLLVSTENSTSDSSVDEVSGVSWHDAVLSKSETEKYSCKVAHHEGICKINYLQTCHLHLGTGHTFIWGAYFWLRREPIEMFHWAPEDKYQNRWKFVEREIRWNGRLSYAHELLVHCWV